MSEERLIKKYANRRLYDASQSRHITLDDIRNMVVAGERVKVIEDKTNADITRLILLQVIADREQHGQPILSTPLLEALIRFYGNAQQSLLSTFLEQGVAAFMRQQDSMRAQPMRPGAASEPVPQNAESWARIHRDVLATCTPQSGAGDAAQEGGSEPATATKP